MLDEQKALLRSLVGRRVLGVHFNSEPNDNSFDLTFDDGRVLEVVFDEKDGGWAIIDPNESAEEEEGPQLPEIEDEQALSPFKDF